VIAQRAAGDLEGIYVNDRGEVTEAISSNVFAIFGDALLTPPLGCCLAGVTRGVLLGVAPQVGLTPLEAPLSVDEIRSADEILLSGSVGRVRSVVELDGRPVATGVPGSAQAALLVALDAASS
jgi:branched-subunit amino acid aminotransferase/4-amino-4-deoxychorismate lyase